MAPPKSRRPFKPAAKPSRPAAAAARKPGLPSREELLAFVRSSTEKVGKREIARAFGIKGSDRIGLKRMIGELTREGLLAGGRKLLREKGGLPPVTALEIVARDDDGDLIAEPLVWDGEEGERPRLLVLDNPRLRAEGESALGLGDRILARCERLEEPDVSGLLFEAFPLKKLPREKRRLLGIFRSAARGGGSIVPIDRKELREWSVNKGDEGRAKDGDLVRFDLARTGRHALAQARVVETLGNPEDQRQISLIAVHAHGIPDDFPEGVVKESESLPPPSMSGRVDLTRLPLLTIDPPDARDHDDAVHAEPDQDPRNPGGFVVTVAIADVSWYVRPGSRLDREAELRGNSVYFPDRVVPMLPERISNDLCSLREGELRPCLAVEMVFDARGKKRTHKFMRAMMRSAAKLSYQQAQAAIDGRPDDKTGPLLEGVLKPLWAAYAALARARDERQPLDLDLPERRIVLDDKGRVARVVVPERLAAHRLIEEMMIQANVAAAEALEAKNTPVVYRVHDQPSKEKLTALRDFLESLEMRLPGAGSGNVRPAHLNELLTAAKDLPVPELINEIVLRSQAQAEYSPQNYGHFGLNLSRYAHFTSPIRRYADLLVHRALVRAMKLGDGGLEDDAVPRLAEVSKRISEAERRAMAAERETTDRLIAAHLADRIGATFPARVSGVTRSGLFVRLADTGADGFVPISSLGNDFFHFIEEQHALVGARTNEGFRLGDTVEVRLVEAIPTAGALRFEMMSEGKRAHASLAKGLRGRRLKPHRPRR
ncbi:MAG: ribonuclease R [Hyphomicrobiaceae bacterium]